MNLDCRSIGPSSKDAVPLTILQRVLLRIQELNADQSDDSAQNLSQEAFRSMIHLMCPPPNTSVLTFDPPTLESYVLRGFQDWNPINSSNDESEITPQFLGAILSWNYLNDSDQESIIKNLAPKQFLSAYVLAIDWAHRDAGYEHRSRYRRILLDKLHPKLEQLIFRSGLSDFQHADLLLQLVSFVSRPNFWLDIATNPRVGKAALSILGHLRTRNRQSSTGILPPMNFEALLPSMPLRKHPHVTHLTAGIQWHSTAPARDLDMDSLFHLETLIFYIRKHQENGSTHPPEIVQYLVDCEETLSSANNDLPDPRVPLRTKIIGMAKDTLLQIQGLLWVNGCVDPNINYFEKTQRAENPDRQHEEHPAGLSALHMPRTGSQRNFAVVGTHKILREPC